MFINLREPLGSFFFAIDYYDDLRNVNTLSFSVFQACETSAWPWIFSKSLENYVLRIFVSWNKIMRYLLYV